MRKIASSANICLATRFSAHAEARLWPNGFSIIMRACSASPAVPSPLMTVRRGQAEWQGSAPGAGLSLTLA